MSEVVMTIWNRSSVIQQVQGMAQLTHGQAASAVDAMEQLIVEACFRGDEVHLECGKFEKVARDGVNGIVFRQAVSVKEYLNGH
jgi:nucleoid DNA-binding protein